MENPLLDGACDPEDPLTKDMLVVEAHGVNVVLRAFPNDIVEDTVLQLLLGRAEPEMHLLKDLGMLCLSPDMRPDWHLKISSPFSIEGLVPLLNQRSRIAESCRMKFEEFLIFFE